MTKGKEGEEENKQRSPKQSKAASINAKKGGKGRRDGGKARRAGGEEVKKRLL